jgi:N-acyl-D-aspartate/D-glutamate deacylase
MRNESDRIDQALEETFRIGREAEIALNIWHLKLGGPANWHRMPHVLEKIEQARLSGLDVAANVYPYVASSTELAALAPEWALEGGYSALLERLRDPQTRTRIAAEILDSPFYGRVGGGDGVLITRIPNPELRRFQRRRLPDVAAELGMSPVDALIHIFLSSNSSGGAVYFMMNEDDVRAALSRSWVSVGADSEAFTGDPEIDGAHPRAYGTFPRVLGHYVREGLFTLEEAVRKVTSQAAARAMLWDRGLLRPGMKADVVVFDANEIADLSRYEDPHHMSVGISDVIVNGVAVLRESAITGELPGRILRRRPT